MPAPRFIVSLPVGGHPVRFYSPPRDVPDYPWFAYVDMLAAMDLPDHAYDVWLDNGRRSSLELTHDLPVETMVVAMNLADMLMTGWANAGKVGFRIQGLGMEPLKAGQAWQPRNHRTPGRQILWVRKAARSGTLVRYLTSDTGEELTTTEANFRQWVRLFHACLLDNDSVPGAFN